MRKILVVFILLFSFFHLPADARYQGGAGRFERIAAQVEWGMIRGSMVMQPKNGVIRDMVYPVRIFEYGLAYQHADAILTSYFTDADQNHWKTLLREHIERDDRDLNAPFGFDTETDIQNNLLDDQQRSVLNFFSVPMASIVADFLSGKADFLSPETAAEAFGRMRPEFVEFIYEAMRRLVDQGRRGLAGPTVSHALPRLTDDVLHETARALVEREQGGVVTKRWETILLDAVYPDKNNAPWAGGHQRGKPIRLQFVD